MPVSYYQTQIVPVLRRTVTPAEPVARRRQVIGSGRFYGIGTESSSKRVAQTTPHGYVFETRGTLALVQSLRTINP